MAASGVGLRQFVVRRLRLYVLNGIRGGEAKASTFNCVRDANCDPDCVFHATGLMAPFNGELDSARRVCFLGDVHARGEDSCLSNGRRGEHTIGRDVNGTNSNVYHAKSTDRRASAGLPKCTNGSLYYVNDSLFVASRCVIRYVFVVVWDVGDERSEASKVSRGDFCSLVLREARRHLYSYCLFFYRGYLIRG